MAKLIHAAHLADIKSSSQFWTATGEEGAGLYTDIAKSALIFTEDGYIVARGTEYKVGLAKEEKLNIEFNDNGTITITDSAGNSTTSDTLPVYSLVGDTEEGVLVSGEDGVWTIHHFEQEGIKEIVGTAKGTSGKVAKVTVDKFGHVTALEEVDIEGFVKTTDVVTSMSDASTDTQVPSAKAVYSAIEASKTQAMVYKGTVNGDTDFETLEANGVNGDTYKVSADLTTPAAAKVGDVLILKVDGETKTWDVIPSGDETETFITISGVEGYDKKSGEVKLGTAALESVADEVSEDAEGLAKASDVADYVEARLTEEAYVKSVTPGVGLVAETTSTPTNPAFKVALASETALSDTLTNLVDADGTAATKRLYEVGLDANGKLAVYVPWTNTAQNQNAFSAIEYWKNGATEASGSYTATSVTDKLVLKAGDNMEISYTADGIFTLSSSYVNTWRNVKAYKLTGTAESVAEVLSSTIGTDDLAFSSDFVWDEGDSTLGTQGELYLGWADVDEAGNVTYSR